MARQSKRSDMLTIRKIDMDECYEPFAGADNVK
jgi:hypothetical protein